MSLSFSELYERIRPRLDLKGSGRPDREGWVTARCFDAANHRNGDEHHSLRINTKTGGVSCMSQGCISGNLNDLAARLDIDRAEPQPDNGRVGTVEELAQARRLPIELVRDTFGVQATKEGWLIPVDDADAQAFRRLKRYPWRSGGPKCWWKPKGCPASDLVYNLTRIDAAATDIFIAAGEPDTWALHHAGLPVISFLAGENGMPSAKAIAKLKRHAAELASVHIVYDHDEAGKRGAHKLADTLIATGLAVDIIELPDDLPEGGDVTDLWRSCDGEGEAFLRRLYGCDVRRIEPQRVRVERREDDAYTIHLPCDGGWVKFEADRVVAGRQKLEAEIAVSVELPGMVQGESFAASLNMLSLSTRRTLASELSSMFPDLPWTRLVNSASGELRRAFYGVEPSVDLAAVEPRESDRRYRVETLLPEGKPIAIYGDGSTGKGWITYALAAAVVTGHGWYGLDVVQGKVMVVDWEDDEQTASDRIRRLFAGANLTLQPGLIDYWPAGGRAFADIADAVGRKVRRDKITMLIIDSAAYACGGDPGESDNTIRFFNALKPIGVTSPIICHVTKDSDNEKPYGSVFWHNACRMTWNVRRAQAEGESAMSVGLYCKKANDTGRPRPIGLRFTFDGETGPVTVERQDVRDVPELQQVRTLKDRLRDALRRAQAEGMTTPDLAEEIGGENEESVYKALSRDGGVLNLSKTRGLPSRWVLKSNREDSR